MSEHPDDGLPKQECLYLCNMLDEDNLMSGDIMGAMHRIEQRLQVALQAIIDRADTNEPGTSKVQDMKRIAVEALGKGEVG